MNSHRSIVKGASKASDIEDIETVASTSNPTTSKLSYSKDMSEEAINKDKTDKRYKLMMQKLQECQMTTEPEERIKSARAIKNEFSQEFMKIQQIEQKKSDSKSSEEKAEEEARDLVAELAQIEPKKNIIKAPNELLEEFLVYVMQKDYPNALKLCGFILIYEPANALAREYLPLLEKKVLQVEDRGESTDAASSSSGDSDLSSSDDSSTSDDSDTDSDSDSGDEARARRRSLAKRNGVERKRTKGLQAISESDDDGVKMPGLKL